MSKLGSLYIELGEPEGELSGCTCEVGDWAADEIKLLRSLLQKAVDGMGGSYAIWAPKARAALTHNAAMSGEPKASPLDGTVMQED